MPSIKSEDEWKEQLGYALKQKRYCLWDSLPTEIWSLNLPRFLLVILVHCSDQLPNNLLDNSFCMPLQELAQALYDAMVDWEWEGDLEEAE